MQSLTIQLTNFEISDDTEIASERMLVRSLHIGIMRH